MVNGRSRVSFNWFTVDLVFLLSYFPRLRSSGARRSDAGRLILNLVVISWCNERISLRSCSDKYRHGVINQAGSFHLGLLGGRRPASRQ